MTIAEAFERWGAVVACDAGAVSDVCPLRPGAVWPVRSVRVDTAPAWERARRLVEDDA